MPPLEQKAPEEEMSKSPGKVVIPYPLRNAPVIPFKTLSEEEEVSKGEPTTTQKETIPNPSSEEHSQMEIDSEKIPCSGETSKQSEKKDEDEPRLKMKSMLMHNLRRP